ncbi:amino acid/amide ABC transporter membrane protein 1 (HAAT family) [Nocardioides aurantiacus]|uniref:Amino acid/amide ABC transporter membrane protein 1 (HAAT family) n=1 Tax=Nocardioides aurantiacus TaxID=86796 RepID=A0A3N2CVC9_9ACTN|nr:amino acid/amide ABC transporter membrane protein 1 (HAAT family) [Nocardioides aurantiacus]
MSPSSRRAPQEARRRGPAVTLLLLLATSLFAVLALSGTAQAADGDRTVVGTLRNSADDNAPVPGVTVNVESSDGGQYTAESNEEGRFEVAVPAADRGTLTVSLDTDTLPDGVDLREGAPDTLRPTGSLSTVTANFALGPDDRQVSTKWDQVPQLLYNGLLFGIVLSLGALGLSMVFGTTGLTNFAHGELVTFGAVMTYMGNRVFGLPIMVAVLMAVVLSAGFGWLNDKGLWAPLRRRGTGLIAMMIVSIGLQFLLRNLYQYFTGGRALTYREYVTPAGQDAFGLFTYTTRDIVIILVSLLTLIAVTLALQFTRLGRATRAVSDNPALAASTGINVNRVITTVWIFGAALAGLGGAFLGFSQSVTYQLGAQVLLLIFAATCVGGLGSIWGAMLGSIIIGLFVETSTLLIPSELKYAGAMILLIVVLLFRPQGLLGRAQRIG